MAIDKNKIKNYVTPHDKGNGSGGVTYIRGGVSNGELPADLNVTSITAAKGDINILSGNTLGFDDGQFIYLGAQNGQITKISGSELNYEIGQINTLTSDKIKTGYLEADEISATKAWLETLNSRYITTEYLTVTKQAHFFELIIDKVRSVGGTLIMTQAQCVVDYAKAVDSNGDYLDDLDDNNAASYDVFWLAQEDGGREVTNDWVVGDQAYCQSFNNVSVGVNYDVSNKYYWRLVTNVLNDRYMNLNTGEELPLSASAQASVNSVTIEFPYIVTLDENDDEAEIATGWNVTAQNIVPGVTWTADSSIIDGRTKGTMTTVNTVFGIQMTPTANSSLANATPVKFGISCTDPARLNIGIYYNDGSSNWFPAPERATDSYEVNLTTDAQIEAVVITNADEVEWKLVHGIRLSNTDCDYMLSRGASIPSKGDNIAQLGYRYDDASSGAGDDKPRASAIIIAAYHTPDGGETYNGKTYRGLTPPSYAQYKLINDYHLSRHRHTFFDALGSEFYGEFYAGTGTDISKYQPVDSQAYHLFIAYAQNDGTGHADSSNWTKTAQGGVSYEFMGFCSRAIVSGETPASVEDTLKFNDYDWSMVPGGTGTPGGHWVNAYKNTQSKTTAPNPPNVNGVPKTLSQLPYDGWYETPQTLQDGEYTWMTQAFMDGNGNMQLWQTAIRLTGADGTPGTDGNEIEFIYTRNNTGVAPAAPPTNTTYPDDWSGTDSNGVTWTDNPQGVSENMMWEYVCQRIKSNGTWGNYEPNPAAVWSKYGEKGQDGDGYEYIYKHFTTEQTFGSDYSNPAYWEANQNDDYLGPVGYEWSDDPVGVDTTDKYEYVAVRKKTSGTWGTFSTPTLWSRYAEQGENGGRYIFMYQNYAASNPPSIVPNGSTLYTVAQLTNAGWIYTATTPNFANDEYTYMTQAFFADQQTTSVWTVPTRITGDNGQPGEDGKYTEFIYKRFTTEQTFGNNNNNPAYWAANQTEDYLGPSGYQWSDNPTGITSIYKYEYMAEREYDGNNFGKFTTPVIWSRWGEKGQDGDGYEYIYKAFATTQTFGNDNNNPAYWSANQSDDYVGPSGYQWSDDPVELNDSTAKYEYVAVRKKTSGTWGKFSTPEIWALYGGQGPTGPQGPQGSNGINGSGYKLVDVGSFAYYEVGLDSSNNVTKSLHISLKYKVAKIVGTTVQYLSTSELDSLPLRPYVMISKTIITSNPTYNYYPFMYETSPASVAICTYTFEPTNQTYLEAFIMNNTKTNLPIVLVPRKPTSSSDKFNLDDAILGQIQDQTSVPVVMGSNAEFKIVKGDGTNGPSIKALVTGQQGINENITTLTLGVQGIQGQVTSLNTEMAGKVDQSTLTQTANEIRGEVVQIYNDANGYAKLTTVDLRSLSTTKFYPVAVSLPLWWGGSGTGKTPRISIRVSRLIDVNYGGPDYSTHHIGGDQSAALDGFPFTLEFSTMPCGYGNLWVNDLTKDNFGEPIFVNKVEISYTQDINGIPKNYIVPAIYQNYKGSKISGAGNDEIIYLRGGSKYDVESSWSGSTITLYSDNTGYYWSSGSDSFQKTPMNYDVNIGPILQDQMTRSEIVQTADSIGLHVIEGLKSTGIDIESGKIDLIADNTNIIGNLNLRRTDNGLTVYDSSNQARINIKPQNTPTPTAGGNTFSSKGYVSTNSSRVTKTTTAQINATTSRIYIGYFSSGNSIKMTVYPHIYGLSPQLGYWRENNPQTILCTAKLFTSSTGTTAAYSITRSISRTTAYGSYVYPSFDWTQNNVSTGSYYFELTITATEPSNGSGYSEYTISAGVDFEKLVTSLTYIGLDGILIGSTNNHFAKISKDGFEFRWLGTTGDNIGGSAVKMSNDGFKRVYNFAYDTGPINWVAFDGYTKSTILTDSNTTYASFYYGATYLTSTRCYLVKGDDVNIFIPQVFSYNIYIRLGDGCGNANSMALSGRRVCIRNFSNRTVYVCSGNTSPNYYIMNRESNELYDRWDVGNAFCTFMAIPQYMDGTNIANWCCSQRA